MIQSKTICSEMKEVFRLNEDIPVFSVTGVPYCEKGEILEIEKSTYLGDTYSFFVVAR